MDLEPIFVRTWCGLCHSRCGIILELGEGRILGVRGGKDSPGA